MARHTRQISLKECYEILNLKKGADLAAVKSAYRRLAFELHPDLNPDNPEASQKFRLLNEAYVALSTVLANEEARHGKTKKEEETGTEEAKANSQAKHAYEEQDILRDLLNDPFARRVFEDIYSELGKKKQEEATPPPTPEPETPPQEKKKETVASPPPQKETRQIKVAPSRDKKNGKGVTGAVQGWLLKQLDEKKTLTLPASTLFPGRKIPLKYKPGLSEEVITIEVTLPPDFVAGKPMRLRGMGKRVGPWQGDLYLTINSK